MKEYLPGPFEARGYADTGPLNERVLAKYACLGWLGKNTLLLNQQMGSYFFLGAILTTLELEPTLGPSMAPPPDLCGSCRRCIDACPTEALVEPYVMDARKCISYLTIELRGSIPEVLREPMGRHVFGCDICQDVCPWNRRAPVTAAVEFEPRVFARDSKQLQAGEPVSEEQPDQESLFLPQLEWLAAMSEEEFRTVFRGSPIKRTKWRGLVRNACIALGNSKVKRASDASRRVQALLEKLAASSDPAILESAQWALSCIQADG
jgi:epoxyqueuosine reductase